MGRFRVSFLECVGAVAFDKKAAAQTLEKRMGVPPSQEILNTLEDNFNRESFIRTIQRNKTWKTPRQTK